MLQKPASKPHRFEWDIQQQPRGQIKQQASPYKSVSDLPEPLRRRFEKSLRRKAKDQKRERKARQDPPLPVDAAFIDQVKHAKYDPARLTHLFGLDQDHSHEAHISLPIDRLNLEADIPGSGQRNFNTTNAAIEYIPLVLQSAPVFHREYQSDVAVEQNHTTIERPANSDSLSGPRIPLAEEHQSERKMVESSENSHPLLEPNLQVKDRTTVMVKPFDVRRQPQYKFEVSNESRKKLTVIRIQGHQP